MINRRIATGLLSIVGALTIAGGATFAYFTAEATSASNTFTAGTVAINIDQGGKSQGDTVAVTNNWMPGESKDVTFKVKNTSSIPVNLRGIAVGSWSDSNLDSLGMVKVTKVEYNTGSGFQTLLDQPAGITGPFYYGQDGLDTALFDLPANTDIDFKVTVTLDENAGDEFQGDTFSATVQVKAKQTNAPTF